MQNSSSFFQGQARFRNGFNAVYSSPFGVELKGRNLKKNNAKNYRFGFQGCEADDQIKGDGNSYDFGMRIHDSRLGRFLSLDSKASSYPFMSPYCFAANNPIRLIDINGEGPGDAVTPSKETIKKGDNYSKLAKNSKGAYTIKDLKEWNPGVDPLKLQVGQKINTSDPNVADLKNAINNSTIPFAENDFTIRPNNIPLFNTFIGIGSKSDEPSLMYEFQNGVGPENSVLFEDHYIVNEVRFKSHEVERMRKEVYKKFGGDLNKMNEYAGENNQALYTNFSAYSGSFKPWNESVSSPMQFIGTFSGDVFLSYDKKTLIFVMTDSKSRTSLYLRILGDIPRKEGVRIKESNTYQKYIWTEPYNPKFLK
jgi:RHS repeat-associated protein